MLALLQRLGNRGRCVHSSVGAGMYGKQDLDSSERRAVSFSLSLFQVASQ